MTSARNTSIKTTATSDSTQEHKDGGLSNRNNWQSTFSHLVNSIPKPKEVWYRGPQGEYKKSVHELEKEDNFTWVEDVIHFDSTPFLGEVIPVADKSIPETTKGDKHTVKHYLRNLTSFTDSLALLDMGNCGKGIVARTDIKKGNLIAPYAGDLTPPKLSYISGIEYLSFPREDLNGKQQGSIKMEVPKGYNANVFSHYNLRTNFLIPPNNVLTCNTNSRFFGNFGRFFPHLPTKEELHDANLPNINKDEIATQNMANLPIRIGCKIIRAFFAERDLKANELVGFSYGSRYWEQFDQSWWLFKKDGTKLVEVEYYEGNIKLANSVAQPTNNPTDDEAKHNDVSLASQISKFGSPITQAGAKYDLMYRQFDTAIKNHGESDVAQEFLSSIKEKKYGCALRACIEIGPLGLELAKILCDFNKDFPFDINEPGSDGRSALYLAASKNNTELCNFLISKGAVDAHAGELLKDKMTVTSKPN